jgi:hypothetical protein
MNRVRREFVTGLTGIFPVGSRGRPGRLIHCTRVALPWYTRALRFRRDLTRSRVGQLKIGGELAECVPVTPH